MENFKIPPMTYSYDSNCDSIIIYNATTESFKDFEYPKGLDSISIQGDYLDHLDVPEGVTSVALGPLGLRTLKLPDGIEYVYVGYNNLREIELPTSIIMVDLGNNPLYHLKFRGEPKELARLELRNTHIHQLYVKIPSDCCIDIDGTPLKRLAHVSKEVRDAYFKNNYHGDGYNSDNWRYIG